MTTHAKVAISVEAGLLRKLDQLVKTKRFSSRSEAVATAVKEKLDRLEKTRLAAECAKLNRNHEQTLADEGLLQDGKSWPEY